MGGVMKQMMFLMKYRAVFKRGEIFSYSWYKK